jgi:hypothetical protein
MSLGVTKSQLEAGATSLTVAGALSGASVSAPSATVNLSTIPGIVDWFCYTFLPSATPASWSDLATNFHWRLLGGVKMLQSFRASWGTAWFHVADTPNVPPTAFSAAAADDGANDAWDGSSGPVHPMTALAKCMALSATNSVNFPDGWGFSLRVPAFQRPLNLDLYVGVMNLDLDITAHLTDGSAPDVTVTISDSSGAGGSLSFRKVTFVFNAGQSGNELIIQMAARNTVSPAVATSKQSFQAAVLHF